MASGFLRQLVTVNRATKVDVWAVKNVFLGAVPLPSALSSKPVEPAH